MKENHFHICTQDTKYLSVSLAKITLFGWKIVHKVGGLLSIWLSWIWTQVSNMVPWAHAGIISDFCKAEVTSVDHWVWPPKAKVHFYVSVSKGIYSDSRWLAKEMETNNPDAFQQMNG